MPPSPDYRLLTLADVEQASHVISQAFINDPLCTFMLPRNKTRSRTLYKFFRAYGEASIMSNRGYGTGEPLQGIAYWHFPAQGDLSISLKALGVFIPLLFTFYPIGYIRARAVINQIDALHKAYANEPHFYLDNLGVLPGARGEGLSSRLIRPFLALANTQKTITYTDTVTRSNVALYEHFGFQSMEERPVPGTPITVWALRRLPQPSTNP